MILSLPCHSIFLKILHTLFCVLWVYPVNESQENTQQFKDIISFPPSPALDMSLTVLNFLPSPVLSVRFEVGVSLLLAPVGADKRGPKAPFPLVENARIHPVTCKRVPAGAPAGAGSYWKHWRWLLAWIESIHHERENIMLFSSILVVNGRLFLRCSIVWRQICWIDYRTLFEELMSENKCTFALRKHRCVFDSY